jgi:glutaredoxin
MNSDLLPILYVKTGCPWCAEAIDFLATHGVPFREQNVSTNIAALADLVKKSGQSKAPTLDWHGEILADFGVAELIPFLQAQGVKLEES